MIPINNKTITVNVLIDTGCLQGNYCSEQLGMRLMEEGQPPHHFQTIPICSPIADKCTTSTKSFNIKLGLSLKLEQTSMTLFPPHSSKSNNTMTEKQPHIASKTFERPKRQMQEHQPHTNCASTKYGTVDGQTKLQCKYQHQTIHKSNDGTSSVNPAHDHTLQIEAVLRQIPTHTHHYDIIIGMPTIVEYDLLSFLRQRWHGNRDGEAEPGDLGGR